MFNDPIPRHFRTGRSFFEPTFPAQGNAWWQRNFRNITYDYFKRMRGYLFYLPNGCRSLMTHLLDPLLDGNAYFSGIIVKNFPETVVSSVEYSTSIL